MPSLGGLPALDVAIGLVALFFLLSTVCSAINEGISNVLGWRAKTLEDAIRSLVGDPKIRAGLKDVGRVRPGDDLTDSLFAHWRMKALVRDADSSLRRRARPSYMPPRAFSLALAEVLAAKAPEGGDASGKTAWQQADEEILERLQGVVDALPEGHLRSVVQKAAGNAGDTLEGFRVQVERLFDDSMERASGWYKRKIQMTLLVLASVVVIGMNVDTVRVANVLWNDQALRSAVAARASTQGTPQEAAAAVEDISQLGLPVGWGDNTPDDLLAAIPGWLITIAALSLGAPFWFDLMSRLSRLRGSGVPERPRSLSDTAGTVENERAERQVRSVVRVEAARAGSRRKGS